MDASLVESRPAERYFGNRPITQRSTRKGSPNKTHTSVRLALLEAYRRLGGVDGLVKWGRKEPNLFYPMLKALLPHELAESGLAGNITVIVQRNPVVSEPKHLPNADTTTCSVEPVEEEVKA